MFTLILQITLLEYLLCSGNHERDWPGTGSFYGNMDSGGECGVIAETMFFVPADNRAKFWYKTKETDSITFYFYRLHV